MEINTTTNTDEVCKELRTEIKSFLKGYTASQGLINVIKVAFDTDFNEDTLNKPKELETILDNLNEDRLLVLFSLLKFDKTLKKKKTNLMLKKTKSSD